MLPTVLIWRQHHTQSVPPAVLGIAVGIVSGVVFLPLAAKVVLGLIGFSAIGPVAGKPHSVTRLCHVVEPLVLTRQICRLLSSFNPSCNRQCCRWQFFRSSAEHCHGWPRWRALGRRRGCWRDTRRDCGLLLN
jgi:hypothetical protein